MNPMGFYFDQTRCTGCCTCVVACKDWHDVPAGQVSFIRVSTMERGKFPDLSVSFLTTSCYHCLTPACMEACPAEAITKRESDGLVLVDGEECTGCGACLDACPYDAPQFGAEADARMQKCDLCRDRWAENKKPICVDACPLRALDAGPIEELRAKYGDVREADGFTYSEDIAPSVVFKPKSNSKNLPLQKIYSSPLK